MSIKWLRGLAVVSVVLAFGPSAGPAAAFDAASAKAKAEQILRAEVAALQASPAVVAAINAANAAQTGYSDAALASLDKAWREETKTGRGPLINPIRDNPASAVLRDHQQKSGGLMAEAFIFGAKGLNVAQTSVTSDYLQADEPKYQLTFLKGPGAIHIEEPKFDESANTYVITASATLSDPRTGAAIGGVTVNVDLSKF